MADSTPLVLQSNPDDLETPLLKKHHPSLDSTIESYIGDFGWAQFMQAILVSIAWVFDAQQTFISIFTDSQPTWHCLPPSISDSCNSICSLPSHSWAWDLPKHTSIVSEWGLECADSIITGLPASSFFMGCAAGGVLLATLADSSLGRKNMLSLSCLVMSLSALLIVFTSNIWMYSALRFVSGFGRATIGTCALVLSTELVGKRWRGQVGVSGFFCFTLGFLSLPAIAYMQRGSSWRNLYLFTSIPTLFYCLLVHFFVRESPRWLFVKGRSEEAINTLKSMAPDDRLTQSCITRSFSNLAVEQETWNIYSVIKILLEKRWAFRRLVAVMIISFAIGLVYYGMPLGLGNLEFNLYLSVTLNALSELPAALVAFLLIGRLDRKISLVVFTSISGICSVMCMLKGNMWRKMQIWFELVSFSSGCTACNIVLIYTLELFPTCVRNSAISMVRQALVLGGALGPVMVAAGGRGDGIMPYGVFGVVIGLSGLFVCCLPETRGTSLSDTMDEEERKEERTGGIK